MELRMLSYPIQNEAACLKSDLGTNKGLQSTLELISYLPYLEIRIPLAWDYNVTRCGGGE